MVKRFYCRSSADLQKSEFCSFPLIWWEKHRFQTVQNNSSRRINEMYWGNTLPNVNYKQYCLKHDFNQEWHQALKHCSKQQILPPFSLSCGVQGILEPRLWSTHHWIWASSFEYSFHIQPLFSLSGMEIQTSMQYRMKCWITLVQKGEASKSVLIRISLQWKHTEMCRLLLPSVSNSYLLSQEQIFSQTQKPTT